MSRIGHGTKPLTKSNKKRTQSHRKGHCQTASSPERLFCHARLGRQKKPSVAAKEAVKNQLREAVQEGETSETKPIQVASTTNVGQRSLQ